MSGPLRAPRRLLVRAPTWVGDVVMSTPVLRALRAAHPQAELWVEGRAVVRPLIEPLPAVTGFIADPGRGVGPLVRRAAQLRSRGFDWAVLLPDSVRAALGPFLAGIPERAGYARDGLRRALLTRALDPPSEGGKRVPISMIERYLRISRALGCPDSGRELDVPIADAARQRVAARLGACGLGGGARWVAVTPGAAFGASKLWPPEHFARACERLEAEQGLRAVLAPGPGEEPLARAIAERAKPGVALVLEDPPLSLEELPALIERAALLLTNDTGPRHLAVALGVPQVVLMGPTDPRHTDHWLERQRVLREPVDCSPCHLKTCPIDHRCMVRLAPERVVAAAAELLR